WLCRRCLRQSKAHNALRCSKILYPWMQDVGKFVLYNVIVSSLTYGAIKSAALADISALHGLAVAGTGEALATIYGERLSKVTAVAIHADIIAQRCATGFNGSTQHLLDGVGQPRIAYCTDAPSGALRMNAGRM